MHLVERRDGTGESWSPSFPQGREARYIVGLEMLTSTDHGVADPSLGLETRGTPRRAVVPRDGGSRPEESILHIATRRCSRGLVELRAFRSPGP